MSEAGPVNDLTQRELDALRGAAVWYAKYRAADVSERATERSAAAVVEREEYLALISALRKLGAPVRVPDGLAGELAEAA
jgi:hypothetical protein